MKKKMINLFCTLFPIVCALFQTRIVKPKGAVRPLHYAPVSSTAIRTISSSITSFFSWQVVINVLMTRDHLCDCRAIASRAAGVKIECFTPACFIRCSMYAATSSLESAPIRYRMMIRC